jgi:hypothetical protein
MGGIRKSILPEVNENDEYYNHEKLLDRWSIVFGSENIIPRIFIKSELLDGDIKQDFISFLGLNWEHFEDVESINESLNADAQHFLLRINQFLPAFIDDKPNKSHRDLVKLVSTNAAGQPLLPTRDEAENFLKIFAESNERLRKKWFPKRKKLFESDFSIYPEKHFLETDYTFAFKIFAEIWSNKPSQSLLLNAKNPINKFLTKLKRQKTLK